MKYIAIIGYGVVGGGITEVIDKSRDKITSAVGDGIEVKYILDLRDFPDSPYGDRVVHDIEPILADREVSLVCETMGGSHPAFEFSVKCMEAGKSVVTSNKEVVANYGDRLLECAKKNGVYYMFEASVGGGIPCIRPFYTSLSDVVISKINGIVNGTTNYILTKMKDESRNFSDVLAEAQKLGYAERDPSADIDGIDAKRKIIILTALATGVLYNENDVYTESLRSVTMEDISAAERLDGVIKYVASSVIGDENEVFVCPMIVKKDNPISHISGVYNGISVTSPLTGDIMYYGRGAGRFPTAGAVLSDVVAVLSGAAEREKTPVFVRSGEKPKQFDKITFPCYLRVKAGVDELKNRLEAVCDKVEIISDDGGTVEAYVEGIDKESLDKTVPDARVIRILP